MSHFSCVRMKFDDLETIKETLDSLQINYRNEPFNLDHSKGITIDIPVTEKWDSKCKPIMSWSINQEGHLVFHADLWNIKMDTRASELVNKINNQFVVQSTLKQIEKTKGLQVANVNVKVK